MWSPYRRISIQPQALERVEEQYATDRNPRSAVFNAVIHLNRTALAVGQVRMRTDLEHHLCAPGFICAGPEVKAPHSPISTTRESKKSLKTWSF